MPVLERPRITGDLGPNSALARSIKAATVRQTTKLLEGMAEEIRKEANNNIEEDLITDRAGWRRKKGARHLKGSIVVTVDDDGTFPLTLSVTSLAERHKVGALEYGSPSHWIFGNPLLKFPSNQTSRGKRDAFGRTYGDAPSTVSNPRRVSAYGNKPVGKKSQLLTVTTHVHHPGHQPGYGFMRKALETVIKRRLRNARL